MNWENILVSTTMAKRAAINAVIAEWGDLTLGELAKKTPFELQRLPRLGGVGRNSLALILEQARAGLDVRHPMHRPIGEAA
jgi:hypothetical protein